MNRPQAVTDLSIHPQARRARKRSGTVQVTFACEAGELLTWEGPVRYLPGAALITGSAGDRWPVECAVFEKRYHPAQGQSMGQDGRYERLPVDVWALRLSQATTVSAGALGDELQGKAGDWWVQYGPGEHGVVAKDVFATSYELTD